MKTSSSEKRPHGLALGTKSTDGALQARTKLGCGCSECSKQGKIQCRLEVGAPDDAHEREADAIADRIVAGEGANASRAAQVRVQRSVGGAPSRGEAGAEHASCDALASVDRVVSSPGRRLEPTLRAEMEQRFGHDFSRVRVHSDLEADRSARCLRARAYTVGQDIVFSSGRFAPNTGAGRRLLAHELTHVVQQRGESRVVQRDMGFEFQTQSKVTTNKGRELGRRFGKFLHKEPPGGKEAMEVQIDTGSVLEFETSHFQRWSALKAQIESAVDVAHQIEKNPTSFPFNNVPELVKQGKLKKGEVIEVENKKIVGTIQATEGIALNQFESLLKERAEPADTKHAIDEANRLLLFAIMDAPPNPDPWVDNLKGFLQLVVFYIQQAQDHLTPFDKASPAKARFRLLSRLKFSDMYRSMLSKSEQAMFDFIVNKGSIPKLLKLSGSDPVFPGGYWGHVDGEDWALFQNGKVVAVAPANDKDKVHDCSSKTKTPGVSTKACGTKMPETVVMIDGWLKSIIGGKPDRLSPLPAGGSDSMGKLEVDDSGSEAGLAKFESRNFRRKRTLRANKWVSFAEDLFQTAAACRPRPTKTTGLIYDGTRKAFDTKKCP